jgi:hypothetical protein
MSTQIRLFSKAVQDTSAFFFLVGILMIAFSSCFSNLGIYFDDGSNFKSNYDTHFNDYAMLDHGVTLIVANLRTAFGDP